MSMIKIVNKNRFGNSDGYTLFENDGTLASYGDATTWTDFSVQLTTTQRGSNNLPDYDYNELGLLFPQNKTDEIIYLVFQMPHQKKMGSPINLHLHFVQTTSTVPVFKAEYRFYNNGSSVPSVWTATTANSVVEIPYVEGSVLNIVSFPLIPAPVNETVSANFDLKLWRDDNLVTGDVLVKYVDIHYEVDTLGSREEFLK